MKIKYEAFDGTVFADKAECAAYEGGLYRFWNMYEYDGITPTESFDDAMFVTFVNDEAALSFIEACDNAGITYDGLDRSDYIGEDAVPYPHPQRYWWSQYEEKWVYLDPDDCAAIAAYLAHTDLSTNPTN